MTHNKNDSELVYYITLFKIEGHSTWRCSIKATPTAFDEEIEKTKGFPKITARKVYRVDRKTGGVKLV